MRIGGEEGKKEDLKTIEDQVKRRRFKSIGIFVAVILAFILAIMFMHRGQEVRKEKEKNIQGFFGRELDVAKDQWIGKGEARLKALEEGNKEIREMIETIKKELKENEEKIEKRSAPLPVETYPKTPPPPPPSPEKEKKKEVKKAKEAEKEAPETIEEGLEKEKDKIGIMTIKPQAKATTDKDKKSIKKVEKVAWLSAGSFMKGTLLTGLDAPTGAQAMNRTIPVLIRVDGNTIGPNFSSFPIAQCFIIGAGWGSMSEERAYIRSELLSCVKTDGQAIEIPIKGHIVGEDGKVGARGRVVNKQGALLAQSLMAGFADGVARAFKSMETTVNVTPLGGTQEIITGSPLKAGLFSGLSRSMEELSRFYMEMAKQIFPVIEVDAGRKVEFLVTEGKEVNI